MDPDNLFLGTVATCITTVFVLGVTTGCGCAHWLREAGRNGEHALRYNAKRTSGTVDQETRSRKVTKGQSAKYPYALTSALSLEVPKTLGPAFLTKEELQKVVRASKHLGLRPDTSKVIRKPRTE